MATSLTQNNLAALRSGFTTAPERSLSLPSICYTDPRYLEIERRQIFYKTWQFACHAEKVRNTGQYVTVDIQDHSIVIIRGRDGALRAFYNVCQHRAHQLLKGDGSVNRITCPYHAWTYEIDGGLRSVPRDEYMENFDKSEICLSQVRVEEFCSLVYVNLDLDAPTLLQQTGNLATEITDFAPDISELTLAHRNTYRINSNWKNVVDNFLECYHCPVAHKDFVSLVEMETYRTKTYGIYSSQIGTLKQTSNTAYDASGAEVTDHAVWWLWPTTCLLRFPGTPNFWVLNIVPISAHETYETYDFFLSQPKPSDAEMEGIEYVDKVLQPEDIDIVESVQRGMNSPGYDRGRYVTQPNDSGYSEHGVHHFHSLVLSAYESELG